MARWSLQVHCRQRAAGGGGGSGGELCHNARQGAVLRLQPLVMLPQGLNLLYLVEVLQENHNTGERGGERQREEKSSDGQGGEGQGGGGWRDIKGENGERTKDKEVNRKRVGEKDVGR